MDPDAFWHQTPRHFQLVMRGVRRKLKGESENRLAQAWQTGAFTGATQSKGGLKPLDHYMRGPMRRMLPDEMLAVMHALAGRQNGKYDLN